MSNQILQSKKLETDNEINLRPNLLKDFIGQEQIKANLGIFIQAARNRSESLDHTLFYGPPGLGKTSLAQIVSKEMGVNFRLRPEAERGTYIGPEFEVDPGTGARRYLGMKPQVEQETNHSHHQSTKPA